MDVIINKVQKKLGRFLFVSVYAVAAFWFLINGEGLFTSWATSWTFNAMIYILGVSLFISTLDKFPEELKTNVTKTFTYFSLTSLATLLVLLVFQDFGILFTSSNSMPYHVILANMTFQLVIVACSEEIIFRGVIFGYLYDMFTDEKGETGYWIIVPYVLQAVLFAFFHFAVYGLNPLNMGIVFVMGLVFGYAAKNYGLGSSVGMHWIWNCMALGLFNLPGVIN